MKHVIYETSKRICRIVLNRPDKRNALSSELITDLKAAFEKARHDTNIKAIILTGEGPAFCAGADLEYIQSLQKYSYEENLADSVQLKELFYLIHTLEKPVIAAVNGHALAGGCGLVTVCDFAFSIAEAKFGYTEVKIGFIPAVVMYFLIQKIGMSRAKELLISGQLIDAEKAFQIGLIHKIVNEENLQQETTAFARSLIENNSSESMKITKHMMQHISGMTLENALDYASKMNAEARLSEDCKKGIDAFLNKTKPNW